MTKRNDQERALFERWLSERDALLLNMRERPLEPVLAWLEEIDALVSAAAQQIAPYHDPRNGAETWAVPEIWREAIHDTLRYYRMSTLEDGEGCGYPLIDAMTADGQSVAGGIEECRYLADALVDALASAPHPVSDLPTCEIAQVADLAGLIVSDVCDIPPEDDGADCVRVNVNDLIAIIKRHLAPHPVSGEQSAAASDVLAERNRQVNKEGWTAEHDDRNGSCELAAAAATYAVCTEPEQLMVGGAVAWPWRRGWWKPTTYRQNLIKAGALIIAEIERLDRAAHRAEQGEQP